MEKQLCAHSCLFKGMCVMCGLNCDPKSSVSVSEKEYINLEWLIGNSGIIASKDYVTTIMFQKDQQNLIERKKLRLVLDLDETLIHTFKKKKFQKYNENFNYNPEEDESDNMDVDFEEQFSIIDEYQETSFIIGSYIYTVIFRPGVEEFLNEISVYFDIYVYTHGTSIYSENIMKLLKKKVGEKENPI